MSVPAPVIETQELEAQAAAISQKIALIAITDQASFEAAVEDRAEIKRRLGKIEEVMGPICEAAHKTWKTAVAKREGLKAPFVEADRAYARAMGAYEQEQERKRREAEEAARRDRERREAEDRARAAAEQDRLRREEEDRRIAAAAAAEQRGDNAAAEKILEQPLPTPTVAPRPVFVPVAPSAPKPVAAGVSFRDNWTAKVTDLMALVQAVAKGEQPITLLQVNQPALNGLARSLKGAMTVPGVEAVNERIAAQKVTP
jgi:hypothetical protein